MHRHSSASELSVLEAPFTNSFALQQLSTPRPACLANVQQHKPHRISSDGCESRRMLAAITMGLSVLILGRFFFLFPCKLTTASARPIYSQLSTVSRPAHTIQYAFRRRRLHCRGHHYGCLAGLPRRKAWLLCVLHSQPLDWALSLSHP